MATAVALAMLGAACGYGLLESGQAISNSPKDYVWQLPEGLQLAIRHHHDPLVAQSYRLEAVLLHIAQLLASAIEEGIDTGEVLAEVSDELWGVCGLSTVDCLEVEAEIGPQVAGLFAVLMGEQQRRSG